MVNRSYCVAAKKNEVQFQQVPNSAEKSTNIEQRFIDFKHAKGKKKKQVGGTK